MNRQSTADAVSEQAAKDLEVVTKEAMRWMQAVTGREMRLSFRECLEDGVILCELMQKISPGSIKKINRRQVAIAHLDNIRQFLTACEDLGLKGSQLFDLTDLQAPGTIKMRSGGVKQTTAERRLSNVCITIYWLGRRVAQMPDFAGPLLNLDAFQHILNIPSSSYMLQGYETEKPYSSPHFTEDQRNFDWPQLSRQNGGMTPEEEADELLASIQNQVDELLLEFQPEQAKENAPLQGKTASTQGPQMRQERVVMQETQLMQEPMLDYPDASSLTPTTPPPPPDEVFITIDMITHSGSFGLQLLGGADTGIPAQVELVVPGRPADVGGVCPGDIIVSVNDMDATDLNHVELTELIKQGGSRGHLTLGIIRRVQENISDFSDEEREMEIPGPATFSSDVSQEAWEEEHAERERQRMEVAMLYGGRKNGLSPLVEESNSSQQEPESETPEGSSGRYSNQVKEEQEKQVETQNQTSLTTHKDSARDFEEELHQLDLLVQQSRSPPDVSKSVPFQPHEWKEPISQPPPPQIHPPIEDIGDEEKEEVEEMEEVTGYPPSAPCMQLPVISTTAQTEEHSQHSDHSHSSDPFAPLQSPSDTSAPLLSEVLSAHSSYSESLPSKALVADIPKMGTLPERPVMASNHIQEHTPSTQPLPSHQEHIAPQIHLPYSKPEKHKTPPKSTPSRIKKIDVPTEVQEVGNGIKVRAVQRTQWTPEASDAETKPGEGEGYTAVMTSERNRRWTYDGTRDKPHAKDRSLTQRKTSLCSYCRAPIARGSMMSIPSQQLYYHPKCLVCVVCRSRLNAGYGHTTVFLRHSLPHCASCYSTDNGIKATTC